MSYLIQFMYMKNQLLFNIQLYGLKQRASNTIKEQMKIHAGFRILVNLDMIHAFLMSSCVVGILAHIFSSCPW